MIRVRQRTDAPSLGNHGGRTVPVQNFPVIASQSVTQSSADLALTLAGGASPLATDPVALTLRSRFR
jgi:hypothetical protein